MTEAFKGHQIEFMARVTEGHWVDTQTGEKLAEQGAFYETRNWVDGTKETRRGLFLGLGTEHKEISKGVNAGNVGNYSVCIIVLDDGSLVHAPVTSCKFITPKVKKKVYCKTCGRNKDICKGMGIHQTKPKAKFPKCSICQGNHFSTECLKTYPPPKPTGSTLTGIHTIVGGD